MKRFFVLVLIVLASSLHAQLIPLDTAVRQGRLPNGFTYYIRHNEEPANRVVFYLANKVGSVLEDDDQRGVAHFIEHMSFNGTTHFPKNELISYLQKAGVRFGADINAYTGFDETVYQLPLPSDSPEVVTTGLQIMHDWANGATLDSLEIEKERGVVLEELRLGKGSSERMRNGYFSTILNNSRYASRMPIGTEQVILHSKPDIIRRFYTDWYRPNLQAIIIVGDVDVVQMEKSVREKFADLKNPVNERPRTSYTVPLTAGNQFLTVTDPEMTYTTAQVIFKQPQLRLSTRQDYRASIVRALYNDMMGTRYAEVIRQADPPFLNAGASVDGFLGSVDAFTISVTARPGELEKGVKAAWREQERLLRSGFTSSELARAKKSYQSRIGSSLREKDRTASDSYVNEYLQHFLHGTASPGIDYEYRLVNKMLSGITLAELNQLARGNKRTASSDVLILAPEKDKLLLPAKSTFDVWIRDVHAEKLAAYVDKVGSGRLLPTEPVAGTIAGRSYDTLSGTSTLSLSNGIRVIIKKTRFRNKEIIFSAFSPGGTSIYSDSVFESATAADLIPSFGAGNYSRTELAKYLSGKELSVQLSIGERSQDINGGAVSSDLGAALELMYAYLVEPRLDKNLFSGMLTRAKAGLENRQEDPASIFQDTTDAVLGNHSIRRTGPSIEKIDRVNPDQALAIFRERFGNAAGFTFVFVGSIDSVALEPLIKKYIASLPVTGPPDKAIDRGTAIPAGVIERTVFRGLEPKASVRLVFSGPFEYSYEDKIAMDALQEILGIRLLERLREEESGVYSPGVSISVSKVPEGRFSAAFRFGCSPANVDQLIKSTLNEVENIKQSGPSVLNLDKFKAEALRSFEGNSQTNEFWLDYLTGQLEDGERLDQFNRYIAVVKTISPEHVQRMANKYLTGKNYIKLVLLPQEARE